MQRLGISPKQLYVLSQLERLGPLNPSQIAELISSDRPTAAVVIRNLERKRWIGRRIDPRDARRFIVSLADEGRRKLEAVLEAKPEAALPVSQIFSCLSAQERARLRGLLNRVDRHLDSLLRGHL